MYKRSLDDLIGYEKKLQPQRLFCKDEYLEVMNTRKCKEEMPLKLEKQLCMITKK